MLLHKNYKDREWHEGAGFENKIQKHFKGSATA